MTWTEPTYCKTCDDPESLCQCTEPRLEWGPFGWCFRLPDGSAAHTKSGFPYHSNDAEKAFRWWEKNRKRLGY